MVGGFKAFEDQAAEGLLRAHHHLLAQVPQRHGPFEAREGEPVVEEGVGEGEIRVVGPIAAHEIVAVVIDGEAVEQKRARQGCYVPGDAERSVLQQHSEPVEDGIAAVVQVELRESFRVERIAVGEPVGFFGGAPFPGQLRALRAIKTESVIIVRVAQSECGSLDDLAGAMENGELIGHGCS